MATFVPPADIKKIWDRYRTRPDSVALRNRLVEIYLPLVRLNAAKLCERLPDSVDPDDMVSVGVFGLLDELRKLEWVPRLVRKRAGQLNEAVEALSAKLGRPPNERELCRQLGVEPPELQKIVRDGQVLGVIGLSERLYVTDSQRDVRVIDTLVDRRGEDPCEPLQEIDLMRLVCKGLNRSERLIVLLYYFERLTFREIGQTLNLSESRVSQMHSAIMRRLAERLGDRRLEFVPKQEGAA